MSSLPPLGPPRATRHACFSVLPTRVVSDSETVQPDQFVAEVQVDKLAAEVPAAQADARWP